MLSLSSYTAQHANTWCKPTFNASAPPSPRWCPNGGPRPNTSGRGAISSGGWSPCPCTRNSQPPPSGRRKPAHCHDLKLALMARVPLLLNALYRTLGWLNDPPPPAPLTLPMGPNPWRRPWSPYSTSHTAQQRPPPTYHPPPPLPDKVAHKPPKRTRPPSPAAHTKARKHARQPPRPVRPLSLKRSTASQPQPEPPPPKRPLTIRDMFNPPPPPPSTSTPPRRLRPRFRPFSTHNKVLRTSPPPPPPRAQTHNRPHLRPMCHLFEKATLTRFSHASPRLPLHGATNQYYHTGTHQSLLQMSPSPKPPPVLQPSCSNPQAATVPPSEIRQRPRLCGCL